MKEDVDFYGAEFNRLFNGFRILITHEYPVNMEIFIDRDWFHGIFMGLLKCPYRQNFYFLI